MNIKYNNIDIPKELDFMVNKTIQKNSIKRKVMIGMTSVAAAMMIFTTSLNVSSTFAETMSNIPVVKHVADLLTFRSYEFKTEEITSTVTVPEISVDENLDEYVNTTINEKVETVLAEAQLRADEYKDAFISTGGTEQEYKEKNMVVEVNYEVYTQDDQYLSFRVFTHETLAAVYEENLYFTIDLKDKKVLSIQDLLGDDFVKIMTASVVAQIEEDAKENPDKYFDDYKAEDFKVRDNIDFYVQDSQLYIVFWKYELAPGYLGRLTFEIPMN